jgi:predicted ATP-binding protein involved in virulence
MAALLAAFPHVQFIVATHSPFIVTAIQDAAVYVLEYDEVGRVFSRRLDYANKAASADDTLRRVLGLESTMPIWAEERFRAILDEHLKAGMSGTELRALREALRADGLESEFGAAMLNLTATD